MRSCGYVQKYISIVIPIVILTYGAWSVCVIEPTSHMDIQKTVYKYINKCIYIYMGTIHFYSSELHRTLQFSSPFFPLQQQDFIVYC